MCSYINRSYIIILVGILMLKINFGRLTIRLTIILKYHPINNTIERTIPVNATHELTASCSLTQTLELTYIRYSYYLIAFFHSYFVFSFTLVSRPDYLLYFSLKILFSFSFFFFGFLKNFFLMSRLLSTICYPLSVRRCRLYH